MKRKRYLRKLLINRKKKLKPIIYLNLARIFGLIGIFFISASYGPSLYYSIFQGKNINENTSLIRQTAEERSGFTLTGLGLINNDLPPFDPLLPSENRIVISSIGVDTEINEASVADFEKALKKGVWRVANFGTPEYKSHPTILAAHRFGYLAWSVPFRLKNSFYKLPKVKTGDVIQIFWNQRKYLYSVYGEGKGEKIEDYSANLILYTCQDLKSSIRIFVYAKLMQI